MRAWLFACAALALAHAAAPSLPLGVPARPHRREHARLDVARLDHIKTQILAKLGLSSRPRPLGAPPRDVVRQILARAADPPPPPTEHTDPAAMREIIAIAHRDDFRLATVPHCDVLNTYYGSPGNLPAFLRVLKPLNAECVSLNGNRAMLDAFAATFRKRYLKR